MNILGPTRNDRLNEAAGVVLLGGAVFFALAFLSYYPEDPSFNTAAPGAEASNIIGNAGASLADLFLQGMGLAAYLLPAALLTLAWCWLRSAPIRSPWVRLGGAVLAFVSLSAMLGLARGWLLFDGRVPAGGLMGMLTAETLRGAFNLTGSLLICTIGLIVSLYLLTSFQLRHVVMVTARPRQFLAGISGRWNAWLDEHRRRAAERRARRKAAEPAASIETPAISRRRTEISTSAPEPEYEIPIYTLEDSLAAEQVTSPTSGPVPEAATAAEEPEPEAEMKIVEYVPPPPPDRAPWESDVKEPPAPAAVPLRRAAADYRLPSTALLSEPEAKSHHDAQELKDIAGRIKTKFAEFNVLGSVEQINPGPVVTTFEYRPEAGIKYSRITTLTEDLCLGLQAESILIERIPGKPTVGIEVPNSRREVISLRQILESSEFLDSTSKLTIAMGKDISGRIKVASLESMPHLLIAGSTGSGKSVMLNSMIMSVLYKATPADVRMILIDPKRVEMGVYENIPHLLTPVITDPRKATNALRNAVLEMERRLKLLASQGVRNIDQYNRKVKQAMNRPRNLFEEPSEEEILEPLPLILIVIDELADLMMIERQGVEESVTRLAQMARAVGMHLVVATQRPSVDVITGLIKANFPARVSFRVATRVDSRTILDVMGAEHLLGKGDMLFLPPGSSRLVRVHAPFVTEGEIAEVTESWKQQARPDYDQSYLLTPPDAGEGGDDDLADFHDPMYEDAVRIVCEVGKASTSTLQRRLRLGYGRASRILDKMHQEGIIGPIDGSRPREVLRRPEWLDQPAPI